MREYLGEIYRLERSPEGVTTSALADRLEVSSAVARVWASRGDPHPNAALRQSHRRITYFTSGNAADFARALEQLDIERGPIHAVQWDDNEIIVPTR